MKHLILPALLFASCTAVAPPLADPTGVDVVWTASGFDMPESVIAGEGVYYVSNVNGEGSEADGNGYISKLGADGEVLERRWVEGTTALPLNAPKGMAIVGGTLFVTDIDAVVAIDLARAAVTARLPVEGAEFLNDAESYQGALLVSDSRTGDIHRVADGVVSLFREASLETERLNGIYCCDGEEVLLATMGAGELLALGTDGSVRVRGTGMENADGIVPVGNGYVVSSWSGQLRYVEEGEATLLLDTSGDEISHNDIAPPIPGTGVDVVSPNWRPGTVTAYRVR